MDILTASMMFTPKGIAKIEKHYNAKYICETCLKTITGDWSNYPVAVFYQETPPVHMPNASNYFGIYLRQGKVYIANAKSALEPFSGIVAKSGMVIYSRYHHDYRELHGSMVDGGRDYLRANSDSVPVKLQIVKDKLQVVG